MVRVTKKLSPPFALWPVIALIIGQDKRKIHVIIFKKYVNFYESGKSVINDEVP